MQSVPITTNVVSSKLVHGDVYSIQHYNVKKFVSDLEFEDTKGAIRIRISKKNIQHNNFHQGVDISRETF
jgi:hypothetical protein